MHLSKITQRYFDFFPGDFSLNPMQRQTPNVLFATVRPEEFPSPKNLIFNEKLSEEIGLGKLENHQIPFLVGNNLPQNIRTYSTVYAGHQFGNWAGQLGDGRAIFAGEITNEEGKTYEIQWKGTGATPYSRHADGRAVLRSSLREYLMSEAMHHLNIPTTRALSLTLTGENVVRDILYNGNPAPEKGAAVVRISPSFLRFGHFEFANAQKDLSLLKSLADFTIQHHYPEINFQSKEKYHFLFKKITENTLKMVVEWLRVGFTHGVMNTDNMSIIGETIDFGPFGILEEYDLNFTPNTTDLPNRRYAFGRQPQIAQWNLWQLANAIFPLIKDETFLENTLNQFGTDFWIMHDQMIMKKFGIESTRPQDTEWITHWQKMMTDQKMDYTLFFTQLQKARTSNEVQYLFSASYLPPETIDTSQISHFFETYTLRLAQNTISEKESLEMMTNNNPKFILRNYLLFQCIEKVNMGDTEMLHQLINALQNPYNPPTETLQNKRPNQYNNIAGCSMLSCSS